MYCLACSEQVTSMSGQMTQKELVLHWPLLVQMRLGSVLGARTPQDKSGCEP